LKSILNPMPVIPETINIDIQDDVSHISGVPEEHIHPRRARIFIPARNAAQAGTNNTHKWAVDFDTRERWENPLMGWSSSGDPLSNISMAIPFGSKEAAINYCERNGWDFEVIDPQPKKVLQKSYGENFNWSKRTRVWTK